MIKVMVFIDGTWLYKHLYPLAKIYNREDFQVDYGKLPVVLADEVKARLGGTDVDLVRTHIFGSYPSNTDIRDEETSGRQLDFYDFLREEYHYEVEVFPIDFLGRRLRREDRDPSDPFTPREKCVDVALATSILYHAAIPHTYDIAVVLIGDQDYKPVLHHVRKLGKRIAIASISFHCARDLADPRDESRLRDFDVIWLDKLLHRIEYKPEPRLVECESPIHKGDRHVYTTHRPRKGRKFYCDVCRTEYSRQKQEAEQQFVAEPRGLPADEDSDAQTNVGRVLSGAVLKVVLERGFGFIRSTEGADYFFHLSDLRGGLEFDKLQIGQTVDFEIKKDPSEGKAGAAQNVHAPL